MSSQNVASKDLIQQPLVSIIMNCYNSERFLKKAIDSIYAQTYSNWEIIFWDNASTDKSPQIVKAYDGRIKYYRGEQTVPLGAARNLALKKALGSYIAFLDCDDLYLPDKLERQVRLMENEDCALSYGSAIIIDGNGNAIRKNRMKNHSGFIFDKLLVKYEINMQTVMIRRSIIDEEKLAFNSDLGYSPDYNLFMEIASRHPIGVMDEFIVKYRILTDSLSRKSLHLASKEMKYTLNSILSKNPCLKMKYPQAFRSAFRKLHYYNAIDRINNEEFRAARKELMGIIFYSPQYLILYFLTLLGFSKETILWLIRR